MKTTTEMQLVPVAKLVPYINNARTHSPEQISKLRSSLREFGFINPVIIDRDFGVIAGHGRILAAKEEGIEEVPCVFCDRTQASTSLILNFQVRPTFTPGIPRFSIHARVVSLVIPRNSAISFIEHQRSGSTNSIQLPLSRFWPPGMSTFQKLT